MEKEYIIVGSGVESEKSKKPYAIAKAIIRLDGKQFLSDRDQHFIEQYIEVGTVITVNQEVSF